MIFTEKVHKLYAGFFMSDSRFNWKSDSPSWLFIKNNLVNFWPQEVDNQFYYEFPQAPQKLKVSNGGQAPLTMLPYDHLFTRDHPAGCCPNSLAENRGLVTKIYFNFFFYLGLPNLRIVFTYQCDKTGSLEEKAYDYTLNNAVLHTVVAPNDKLIPPFDRWKSKDSLTGVQFYKFTLEEGYPLGGFNCASGDLENNDYKIANPVNFTSAIHNGLRRGAKKQYFVTGHDSANAGIFNMGTSNNEYSWQETGPRDFYIFVNYEPPGSVNGASFQGYTTPRIL